MANGQVVVLFIAGLAVSTLAMPQGSVEKPNADADGGFLPFLQFTNGGVRVNFGGYHASAGLGGLLGGSRTGGGLHVSAGTPQGAHASAGLGGLLGGDNSNAGGGLYARAGLGNGRPEAGAGLGGMLDGSGRSNTPAQGGLYAGASTGDAVVLRSKTGRTNIQVIPARIVEKNEKDQKEIIESDKEALYSNSQSTVNEQIAIPRKTVEKVKVSGGTIKIVEKDVSQGSAGATVIDSKTDDGSNVAEVNPGRGRWYFRKRLRASPARKTVYKTIETNVQESPAGSASNIDVLTRSSAGADAGIDKSIVVEHKRTLFDDIFNIPISTLNAVNQLLKNNAG